MARTAEVVIIRGGVTGTSLAFRLAPIPKRGCAIVIPTGKRQSKRLHGIKEWR